ncbi:MAG: c-type cytochrome [Bacteroidetes bacterium]|nr:c-type cytochrome [Bacteroidota bacterium]
MIKILFLISAGFLTPLFHVNKSDVDLKNGETIFKTGKNLSGEVLQDMEKSEMSGMQHSCAHCHGESAEGKPHRRMGPTGSIKFKDLSDANLHKVPYTDELFFRFLDKELKSDGSPASTGVVWKMSEKDRNDLLAYLKTLN